MKTLLCIASLFCLTGFVRAANTLYVANNGVDSLTCGAVGSPCRSISQAIHNAGAGDTVIVGPGRYGDVDYNGNFADTGDEAGPLGACNCIVHIDKPITLLSRSGADTTFIDGGFYGLTTVLIEASGAIFGGPKHGFTVTGGDGAAGVRINAASDVSVAGLRAIGNARGIQVTTGSTNNTIAGNVISLNDNEGCRLAGHADKVFGNIITGNGNNGITILENQTQIINNFIAGNFNDGIQLSANNQGVTIDRNSILSSERFGILLATNSAATITRNNIFGNNDSGGNFSGQSKANAGVGNNSGHAVTLTGNFFGAATGPGANPADIVADYNGSSTTNAAFSTKEIKLKPVAP